MRHVERFGAPGLPVSHWYWCLDKLNFDKFGKNYANKLVNSTRCALLAAESKAKAITPTPLYLR
jgi:hypothetical protein